MRVQRPPEDEIFYPLMTSFKGADEQNGEIRFEALNAAFKKVVMEWNLWRILSPTLEAAE